MAVAAGTPMKRLTTMEQIYLSFFWLSSNVLWGAVLNVLVQSQVIRMVPDALKGTAAGLAVGIGSITGLALPPIMGAVSDRARFKMGRRRPFMLIGTAINLLGLAGMAYFPFLSASPLFGLTAAFWFFVAAYLVTNFGSNFATAPFNALMPDVVSEDQRGAASGWLGLMTILGNAIGTLAAGFIVNSQSPLPQFMSQVFTVYAIIGVILVIGVLVTVLGTKEKPLTTEPKPFKLSEFWAGLLSPFRSRDFFWVFFTRLVMTMGFASIQNFLVFYMRDVTKTYTFFGKTLATSAESAVTFVLLTLLLFAVPSSFVSGYLSDRFGRKPLVYISGGVMTVVALGLIVAHAFEASIVIGALFGIGYGAYTTVDWALVTDVLPSREDAAKDMGIWHVALTFPQLAATPLAGFLLDNGQRLGAAQGIANLGYTILFVVAIFYFAVGTIFVARVKKAR